MINSFYCQPPPTQYEQLSEPSSFFLPKFLIPAFCDIKFFYLASRCSKIVLLLQSVKLTRNILSKTWSLILAKLILIPNEVI